MASHVSAQGSQPRRRPSLGAAQNAKRPECQTKFCRNADAPEYRMPESALCAKVRMPKVLMPKLNLRSVSECYDSKMIKHVPYI